MECSKITVRLPKPLCDRLDEMIRSAGRTIRSAVMTSALSLYLGALPEEDEPPGKVVAELANHLSSWARRLRQVEDEADGLLLEMVTGIAQSEDHGGDAHLARFGIDDWLAHTDDRKALRDVAALLDLWSRRVRSVEWRTRDPILAAMARTISTNLNMTRMLASQVDRLDDSEMREQIRQTATDLGDLDDGDFGEADRNGGPSPG